MGRLIYRMCLIVVLVIAVAGGVYYYTTFYQKEDGLHKGTFVNSMDSEETDAQPAMQAASQLYETAENISGHVKEAGREIREAFAYVGGAAGSVSAKAGARLP